MRIGRILAAFVASSVAMTTLVASPSWAASRDAKLVAALHEVGGNRVMRAAPSVSDYDSTAQTAFVDIPRDPTRGVRMIANGKTTTINLPDASNLTNGVRLSNGAAVYRNRNGSAQVVILTAQHDVQFLIVAEEKGAPESYQYPINLSGDAKIELAAQGAAVFEGGKPVAFVAAPWAQAASGAVPTHFATDGKVLTQHIAHRTSGTKYPVVADPHVKRYWNGLVITLTRAEMATVAYGGSQALIPLLLLPGVGWGMIVGVLGMSAYAAWAYHNRKCAWFWVSLDGPTWGWYDC